MPKLNRSVQKAQGMLNQMSSQEQQNAQQLNSLQQKEETATQQIQQMEGMLNQLSSSATGANYEFGSELGTTGLASSVSTAGLASNSGVGVTATSGLASDAMTQNIGQSVQSYYQGGQVTNVSGLADNANVGNVSTSGLASSIDAEMSDYQQS